MSGRGRNLVSTLFDALDYIGVVLADEAVEKDCRRQPEFVEHPEDAPDSDPQAVVSPSEVSLRLARARSAERITSKSRQNAKCSMFSPI